MKSILHFLNESDFQSFTSQLFGEEMPDYMSIEGAGGDGGFDGIEGDTIFQMFFPEPKNRTKQHYIKKIDADIPKARATADKLGFDANNWVLVVPEDLSTEVTVHLINKAKESNFKGTYWGANKLASLVSKYPHIKEAFPGVFLPELKSNVKRIDEGVDEIKQQLAAQGGEVMTDTEYTSRMQNLKMRQQQEMRTFSSIVGNSSAQQQVHQAVNLKYQPLLLDLGAKKAASDRLYELEKTGLETKHNKRRDEINQDHSNRGVFHSGMRINALRIADEEFNVEAEKLALKYGKLFEAQSTEQIPDEYKTK
jgi:hypothetical protein